MGVSEKTSLLGSSRRSASSPPRAPAAARRSPTLCCSNLRGDGGSFATLLFVTLILAYVGALAFATWSIATAKQWAPLQAIAAKVAGVCVAFALPIALFDLAGHFSAYVHPIQRHYVRILMMAPVYSIESYLALQVPQQHQYIETAREAYESVMLLSLFNMVCESLGTHADVVAVLEGGVLKYAAEAEAEDASTAAAEAAAAAAAAAVADEDEFGKGVSALKSGSAALPLLGMPSSKAVATPDSLREARAEAMMLALLDGSCFACSCVRRSPVRSLQSDTTGSVKLLTPFCCLGRWRLGPTFLSRCKFGVAQYVVMRIACSVITLVMKDDGTFGDGNYDAKHPSLWITLAINVSQLWALWCLIFFATTLWPALRPLRPLPKFLLVKVVVFGFWWQSVTLDWFATEGWLKGLEAPSDVDGEYTDADAAEMALVLQNVLIAVEIAVVAVMHHFAFAVGDFQRPSLQAALVRQQRKQQLQLLQQYGSGRGAGGTTFWGGGAGGEVNESGVGDEQGGGESNGDARSPSRMLAKAANVLLAAAGGGRLRHGSRGGGGDFEVDEEAEGGVCDDPLLSRSPVGEERRAVYPVADGGSASPGGFQAPSPRSKAAAPSPELSRARAPSGLSHFFAAKNASPSSIRRSASLGALPSFYASSSQEQDGRSSPSESEVGNGTPGFGRGTGTLAAFTDLFVPLDTVADSVSVVTGAGSALWQGASAIALWRGNGTSHSRLTGRSSPEHGEPS